MAEPSITHKICTKCGDSKLLTEFHKATKHPSGHKPWCKACIKTFSVKRPNSNAYVPTVCAECGTPKPRRSDAIKKWNGLCQECSIKATGRHARANPKKVRQMVAKRKETINGWSPERKAARTEALRQQVLSQGGVPNAIKFCRAGEENGRDVSGEKNYQWKGDLAYLNRTARLVDMGRSRYRAWRKAVFERDDYTCQFCGQRGGKLEADHVLPYSTHVELRYEVSNGRTLCKPCHRTTETYGARALHYKVA